MEPTSKVQLSFEADQALDEMFQATNENFLSGRVKKAQLLSWIILYFHKAQFKKSLKKIRDDHFDKIAHLRSLIKKMEEAKKNGKEISVNPQVPSKAKNKPRGQVTEEDAP